MFYTVYRTINAVNNKEYVGFHKIPSLDYILFEKSAEGSIFKDGYLGSGKLLKKALEKYGPLAMYQELLLVTECKEEAQSFEREIVNVEYVHRDDTYNVSLGGNVCILVGKHNGFYGKKHTPETIDRIQASRNKTKAETPFGWSKSYLVADPNVVFFNRQEISDYFGVTEWFDIVELFIDGKLRYASDYLTAKVFEAYEKRKKHLEDTPDRREKWKKQVSERFKGKPKTRESNIKRGASIRKWIKNNPEKHRVRMEKINKNPAKIRKMAEKQTGKIWINNPHTAQTTRHDPSVPIPNGWVKGSGKQLIHNPSTGQMVRAHKSLPVPEGWVVGKPKGRADE